MILLQQFGKRTGMHRWLLFCFLGVGVFVFLGGIGFVAALGCPLEKPHTKHNGANPKDHTAHKPPNGDVEPKVQTQQDPCRNAPGKAQDQIQQQAEEKASALTIVFHDRYLRWQRISAADSYIIADIFKDTTTLFEYI